MNFRKAADGGNLLVIMTAIGVLILIGLYLTSKSLMADNASVSNDVKNALQQGVEELKK